MSARVYGVCSVVMDEMDEMRRAMDKAEEYAMDYLAHLVDGEPRPQKPVGVHPKVAAAVRDVVLDAACVQGMVPARFM